jgi:hypothetical protein
LVPKIYLSHQKWVKYWTRRCDVSNFPESGQKCTKNSRQIKVGGNYLQEDLMFLAFLILGKMFPQNDCFYASNCICDTKKRSNFGQGSEI